MDQLNYPNALSAAFWDKQKAALAKLKPTTVRVELEKLNRAHDLVDWRAFGTDKPDSVQQAEERLVDLEKAAKRTMTGLASQAEAMEMLASQ